MKKALTLAVLYTFPLVAFAQTPTNLIGLISFAGDVANRLIPLLIAVALVVFFWGLVLYIWGGGGEKAPKAKDVMVAGLLGLFGSTESVMTKWGRRGDEVTGYDDQGTALVKVPMREPVFVRPWYDKANNAFRVNCP